MRQFNTHHIVGPIYAIDRMKYQELPVEERMKIDQANAERSRLQQLETSHNALQQQAEQQAVSHRNMELDYGLQSSDVLPLVQSYNAQQGDPQAFRNLVVERGIVHANAGRDLSVQEAIQDTINVLGLSHQAGASAQQTTPANTGVAATNSATQAKPVLPNIQSKGTTPVKAIPNSIDDLRNIYQQKYGR